MCDILPVTQCTLIFIRKLYFEGGKTFPVLSKGFVSPHNLIAKLEACF